MYTKCRNKLWVLTQIVGRRGRNGEEVNIGIRLREEENRREKANTCELGI